MENLELSRRVVIECIRQAQQLTEAPSFPQHKNAIALLNQLKERAEKAITIEDLGEISVLADAVASRWLNNGDPTSKKNYNNGKRCHNIMHGLAARHLDDREATSSETLNQYIGLLETERA